MNYSYCKKDFKNEVNNRFENYLNDRDVNKNILENNTHSLETSIKNETKIISECKKILASYKCPKSIDFLTELPRSTSGKVLKRQLRKPYWVASNKQVN